MKKLLTLLTLIVILATSTAHAALANETVSSNEEKAVYALLIKPVDRKTINELLLNEMQYIQLKNLSKQYQKDVASLSKVSLLEETPEEVSLQLINLRYFNELSSILTETQISAFLQQNLLTANN